LLKVWSFCFVEQALTLVSALLQYMGTLNLRQFIVELQFQSNKCPGVSVFSDTCFYDYKSIDRGENEWRKAGHRQQVGTRARWSSCSDFQLRVYAG